jgi:hypothetical protein
MNARDFLYPSRSTTSATELAATRDVFWNNVVRDMLNGLAVLSQQKPELFDGRFAVLTHAGERIPIAKVFPIFACSVPGTAADRETSIAVQCTIFRIQTPGGEVFTLPVQQIRALHSITPELIEQLQKVAELEAEGEEEQMDNGGRRPFGFAAFSSLPRPINEPPPEGPTE